MARRMADEGSGPAPVFLVGPARSGTTLVYKTLCLHPDVAYVSNWVARFPSVPQLAALNRVAPVFAGTRSRTWFGEDSNAYVYGRRRAWSERIFPMPVEGEPVYAACGISAELGAPIGTSVQAQKLVRSFERIRGAAGGEVLVSKRISNNRRIGFLARAFPSARFVAIVRDGRAVALSLSRVDWWQRSTLPWFGGTPARWAAEGRDPWEACARNWVEDLHAMEEGLSTVPGDRIMRLSYESFVGAPQETLGHVAEFAGLRPRANWYEALSKLEFPNKNGWHKGLDDESLETITSIQKRELEAYGYDL
jgi:omega-hydroxy-beta-dihydromenaquinone-9 sulfotransferase